jgi:manganese efflux pump family protein
VLAVLLIAGSLGLSNFAASIGIGITGVDARTRLRVGVIFGLFETGMPILGLVLGHNLARSLGHTAHWIGAALLIVTGVYAVIQPVRARNKSAGQRAETATGQRAETATGQSIGRLLVTGVALSVDNLAVGFALGTYHVGLIPAATVIGAVSVCLSLIGLELGRQLGAKTGEHGEMLGGLVLIGVGVAIATGAL